MRKTMIPLLVLYLFLAGSLTGFVGGYVSRVVTEPARGRVAPCPAAPLSDVTATDIENSYTCVRVTATVESVDDLEMTPPRYALTLMGDGAEVYALWPSGEHAPEPGQSIQVTGVVVNLGVGWGLVIIEWTGTR